MIKQLILLIQVLGLFFYQLIFVGDIMVTQKVPNTIVSGKEATIEIFINKADAAGFAKVQQIIPEGFTVEPLETKGATFSFKGNKVKFIWMSLPSDKEFTISYQLKPNASTVGDFEIGGKFSFIADSERKNIEIPVANFTVVAEELIADEVVPEIDETLENNSSEVIEAIAEVIPVEAVVNKISNDLTEEIVSISVNCKRRIETVNNKKFKVTIEIDQKGVEGFAKISETLPQGFIASENESKGGVFSFKRNEVKILWMGVPNEDSYVVNYFIEATESITDGNYEISGQYFYLDNDISSKSDIDKISFNYTTEELLADETSTDELEVNKESNTATEESVEETFAEEQVLANNEAEETDASGIERLTNTPNPEHGVTYKIQIAAGHKTISSTYFETKYNLKDNVSTINHEGWIKYLVGAFDEYKLARDKRDLVRNKIKDAFVTAYNSGSRITVQEALMISNQKWYK
jgi:hypothetical protein